MRRTLSLTAILSALLLTACSGGGGNTGSIPSVRPTPAGSNKVSIGAGFSMTNPSGLHRGRTPQAHLMDVGLLALPALIPVDVPDPYIHLGTPNTVGVPWAVVYLTTSDGTLNGIPDPLPSPSYGETGPQIPVAQVNPAPMPTPTGAPVMIGNETFAAPTQTGVTTIIANATVNNTLLTASMNINAYPALCLAAANDNQHLNCAVGLSWNAFGTEQINGDNVTADAYLQLNSDGTDTIVFNYGAVAIPPNDPAFTAISACPSIPTGIVTFPANTGFQGGPTIAFRTQSGLCVKWQPSAFWSGSGSGGINTDNVGDVYGMYLVSDSAGNFAY